MRYDLTDFDWSVIAPLLPNQPRGLPERYGPHTTCYNRFDRWRKAGIRDRTMDAILAACDGEVQMINRSVLRAHPHAANSKNIATRHEKRASNYLATIKLAAIRIWLRNHEYMA